MEMVNGYQWKVCKFEGFSLADGCYHVYLDVGSNVGVQVRKLFEPELYPNATIHKIFDYVLGRGRNENRARNKKVICAVGFEPNPNHTNRLRGKLLLASFEHSALFKIFIFAVCGPSCIFQ